MAKSKKVEIRLKEEYQIKIQNLMKIWGTNNLSEVVRTSIDRALDTEHERQQTARDIQELMNRKRIRPEELGIKEKRKYLGR